ncbi:MAG: 4-hydroxy-3-methylbut-2-enyl diphosphate reductase [Bacteroidetes bacterium]|nr:4-hydroxy-3-methylbut-2-enyl diphosphate reductase [Bacteroidota bacterium]MBS1931149.1 4-hydroxy-3-methylbut-2-enyl diphosphate reductase [Bacteroidota bacterium]
MSSLYKLRNFAFFIMKSFDVPIIYRSPLISAIKRKRKEEDRLKKDFSPTLLDFGPVQIFLSRHFGFCYGVENAIEIAFRTIEENPGKRIFLLSEMIHNPHVNSDLKAHGVKFLQDTFGRQLIPFEEVNANDIVLIPAFGTTLEIEKILNQMGIHTELYDTTCPFVEKVWNRSQAIAKKDYSIIIHGKPQHEETRATFSHASLNAPSVVVKDMNQAIELSKYITGEKDPALFYEEFRQQYSEDFDISKHLQRIGVVNQTTMLASDTQAIADFLKNVMIKKYNLNAGTIEKHFADTRDTLCYATNDNQTAVSVMLQTSADLAIVVGGYNSSNTSHLVELCEAYFPTYFINDETKIISANEIHHYNFHAREELITSNFLPDKEKISILMTSGASCPDALVEGVIEKIINLFPAKKSIGELINLFSK